MLTSDEAIQIIISRNLSLRPTREGLWVAETATGTRLHREAQTTPALAVELAEQTILLAEQRQARADSTRLIGTLSTGKFFVRPRITAGGALVFDGLLPDNTSIPEARGQSSFTQAVIEAGKVVS